MEIVSSRDSSIDSKARGSNKVCKLITKTVFVISSFGFYGHGKPENIRGLEKSSKINQSHGNLWKKKNCGNCFIL